MKKFILYVVLSPFLLLSCNNSNDRARESDLKTRDSSTVATDNSMTRSKSDTKGITMGNEQAVQQALWAQYDAIKEIRNSIPDSIQSCRSSRERYFFNQADGNLDHIQSDIRNRSDSILLQQLKVHTSQLSDVITSNEMNLNRLDNFTKILKHVTFAIYQTINLAGSLASNGMLKAKIPAAEPNEETKAGSLVTKPRKGK